MEFVDGGMLMAVLDCPCRMPLAPAAEIIRGLLLALDTCYRLAQLPVTIKPSKIMVPSDGEVKQAISVLPGLSTVS